MIPGALVLGLQTAVMVLDPLVKVFPDTPALSVPPHRAEVARGEVASWQVVVRPAPERASLRLEVQPPAGPGSHPPARVRVVAMVPVEKPTQKPSLDQLRKPPALFPDPLIPIDEHEGPVHALWVDVSVPMDAKPGDYTIPLKVGDVSVELPLRVHRAQVGRSRLWVTNWFVPRTRMDGTEEELDALRRIARNMAEHRQNTAIINPLNLVRIGEDGSFDFSRFDSWVRTFQEAGVDGRIEGGHLGGREGGWESPFVINVAERAEGATRLRRVKPDSADAEAFHSRFLPALVRHLKERGWLGRYLQHIADEPIRTNIGSYRQMADLVRRHAPELKILEATHTKELTGSIDVWVPQLDYWARDQDHYTQRQKAGDEVWFYTCVYPQGEYANRFIEQPLLKVRLLHWLNFRFGATGYLHWGYNFWQGDPYRDLNRPHGGPPYLPAGDPWVVYPGRDGVNDSIRWEAMRDGIADYELLSTLAEKHPELAKALAKRLIFAFDRYEGSVEVFRNVRRELLRALD